MKNGKQIILWLSVITLTLLSACAPSEPPPFTLIPTNPSALRPTVLDTEEAIELADEQPTQPTTTQANSIDDAPPPYRCGLYADSESYTVNFLEFTANVPQHTLYITIPSGIPGLDFVPDGDSEPWIYDAELDKNFIGFCGFWEIRGRLYCSFIFPKVYSEI